VSKKPFKDLKESVLRNWQSLSELISTLTEEECWDLLKEERAGLRRIQFMLRLYGRANKLRGKRERSEIFQPLQQ
jgi:hypothetical protein